MTYHLPRVAALSLALSLSLTSGAFASPLDGKLAQDGLGIEVGAIVQGGRSEFASNDAGLSPSSQGIVIRDRNGLSSRMVIGLLIAVAGAMAQVSPKSVESKSYVSGDYVVTETTTTYYSEAEKAQMREQTSKSIDGVFSTKFSDMELQLYSRDHFGVGESSGYKTNFYVGSGESIALESGFGFGVVDSIVDAGGTPTTVTYKYFGMPFRASVVAGPLRLALSYEWNWLKYGVPRADRLVHMDERGNAVVRTVSHPWHFDVSSIALGRVSLTAGVTAQQIRKTDYGYYLQAGVMF